MFLYLFFNRRILNIRLCLQRHIVRVCFQGDANKTEDFYNSIQKPNRIWKYFLKFSVNKFTLFANWITIPSIEMRGLNLFYKLFKKLVLHSPSVNLNRDTWYSLQSVWIVSRFVMICEASVNNVSDPDYLIEAFSRLSFS